MACNRRQLFGQSPKLFTWPKSWLLFLEIDFFHKPITDAFYSFVEEQAELLANTSNYFCTQNIEFLNGWIQIGYQKFR